MKLRFAFVFLLITQINILSQVLTSDPIFPTRDDSVVVIYDAALGNGALNGVFPIYFHTGVITDQSTSPTDWRYVQTTWGSSNSEFQMQYISGTRWKKGFNINEYYGVPPTEQILSLAFVFRNADGSNVGRDTDGSDMFLPIFKSGLNVKLVEPSEEPLIVNLNDQIEVFAASLDAVILSLYINDSLVSQTSNDSLFYTIDVTELGKKRLVAVAEADSNNQVADSTYYVARGPVEIADLPQGVLNGTNYIDANTVTLALFAPAKEYIYVIGDFNNWEVEPIFNMKRTPNDSTYWLTFDVINPGAEYAFQYLVDGTLRIADPYTEKILDPRDDVHIDSTTYPNLKLFPVNKTFEAVSIIQTNQQPYQWQNPTFTKPKKTDLVIYEFLLRDFILEHDYQTLFDTLDYLENLGVNAIELMPFNEFEGNNSWGYNPSFYFAPDKYYGPKETLKAFVDECHGRGIAVIQDIALNHTFGQSPFVRLYNEGGYGAPTPDNPWLNPVARHPFNVGYDFNHESPYTKMLVDRVTSFWINEYHIDGFRFDLSKGFTQFNSGSNVGLWGQYDQSRIDLLTRIADHIWGIDSTFYVILEHFADNNEEVVLSNYGMMIWGNLNHEYLEASMGYNSNLTWGSYKARGWNDPHLITYMESHDEERMMYKNLQFGNSSGNYNTKELNTALNRVKLCSAFFYTIPGPKMLWQFGELGYDFSINWPSGTPDDRLTPKPIRWDYFQVVNRRKVYKVIQTLTGIKNEYDVFRTTNFNISLSSTFKRIKLNHFSMNAVVLGNFGVTAGSMNPDFQQTGRWYDFFSGDSIEVTNTQTQISLEPGEFHIYTTVKLPTPEAGLLTLVDENESLNIKEYKLEQNYPNPFNPTTRINYQLPEASKVILKVYDVLGREIATIVNQFQNAGKYSVEFSASGGLSSGVYFYRISAGDFIQTKKMLMIK